MDKYKDFFVLPYFIVIVSLQVLFIFMKVYDYFNEPWWLILTPLWVVLFQVIIIVVGAYLNKNVPKDPPDRKYSYSEKPEVIGDSHTEDLINDVIWLRDTFIEYAECKTNVDELGEPNKDEAYAYNLCDRIIDKLRENERAK